MRVLASGRVCVCVCGGSKWGGMVEDDILGGRCRISIESTMFVSISLEASHVFNSCLQSIDG